MQKVRLHALDGSMSSTGREGTDPLPVQGPGTQRAASSGAGTSTMEEVTPSPSILVVDDSPVRPVQPKLARKVRGRLARERTLTTQEGM
jgi:hypothetical protein